MAWESIKRSCGHTEDMQFYGPRKEREWKIARAECELCSACREKEIAEENAKSAKKASELGLPQLTGSDKQIAWAETIRMAAMPRLDSFFEEMDTNMAAIPAEKRAASQENYDKFTALLSAARFVAKASWWIDRREDWARSGLRTMISLLLEDKEVAAILKQQADTKTAEAAVVHEVATMVKPESVEDAPIADVVVERKDSAPEAGTLAARLIQKDDQFREVVRGVGLRWDGDKRQWSMGVSEMSGPLTNRAAELIHALLAAGFAVRSMDDTAIAAAQAGSVEPEHKRWIARCRDGARIKIICEREDDANAAVRRVKSARWDRDEGGYALPMSAAKDAEELARLLDFRFTALARKAVDDYRAELAAATVVTPAPVASKEYTDDLAAVLESSREVLPDLRDD